MAEIGLEVLEHAPVAEQRVAALEGRVERQPLAVLVPQLLDRLPALVEEQQVAEQHLELLVLDRAARVELQGLVRRGQRVRAVEAGQQLRHRARHRRGVDRPRAVEPDAAVERLPLAGRRQLQPRAAAAAAARGAAAGRAAQGLEQLVALLRDEAHPALRPVAAPAPVALLPRARDVHHLAGLVDVHHLAVLADLGVRRHADARAAAVLARRRLGHCVRAATSARLVLAPPTASSKRSSAGRAEADGPCCGRSNGRLGWLWVYSMQRGKTIPICCPKRGRVASASAAIRRGSDSEENEDKRTSIFGAAGELQRWLF